MPTHSFPIPIPVSGMNRVAEQTSLDDTNAWYLLDVLNDFPGKVRQRGDLKALAGYASITDWIPEGIGITTNPANEPRVILIGRTLADDTPQVKLLSDDFSSIEATINLGGVNSAEFVCDTAPVLGGGLLITVLQDWRRSNQKVGRYHWRGAIKPTYTTGNLSCSVDSTSVTGSGTSWLANVEPGMFVLNNGGRILGVVSSVESDTELTLERNARDSETTISYSITAVRKSFPVNVSKGTITCSTGSTTVTGAGTKFADNFLAGATNYALFRAKDYVRIGTVDSVTNDTTLTLDSNAAIALSGEEYIAIPISNVNYQATDSTEDLYEVGAISVPYANRQFYMNWPDDAASPVDDLTSRVWYSEPIDFESVDVSLDGDFFSIPHRGNAPTAGLSVEATPQALLALKGNVCYAVTGNSPSQFVVRHLLDDGCLDSRGIQYFEDTVLWPGRLGLYAYDGLTVANLIENSLGQFYQEMVKSLTPITDRIGSAIHRDHYFVYFDTVTPPEGFTKAGTETIPTRITIAVNLRSLAVSFWLNFAIYAAVIAPAPMNPRSLIVVYDTNDDTKLIDPDQLFGQTQTTNDAVTCKNHTAGPDFYWESKLYPLAPEDLLKYVKWLELNYRTSDGSLVVETFTNLEEEAVEARDTLPNLEGKYGRHRVDTFRRHAPFFGFRVYKESVDTKNIAVIQTRVATKPHRESA